MSKKIVAMLMAVAMAFSLLPVTAFATGETPNTTTDGVVYGHYNDEENWESGKPENAIPEQLKDTVTTVNKTAEKVTGQNNQYEVTLTVQMKHKTTEVQPGAAATVLVIDKSGSMNENNRLSAAKTAAINFLKSYSGFSDTNFNENGSLKNNVSNKDLKRYVSLVTFNDSASLQTWGKWNNQESWIDVSTKDGYNKLFDAINKIGAGGGTNLDAALRLAKTQSDKITQIEKSKRNVIALTDGVPTYYVGGGQHTDITWNVKQHGNYGCPTTNQATATSATALKAKVRAVYTVCFGAKNQKCWEKNSDCGFSEHKNDGPTVGDFLRDSIATKPVNDSNEQYAYNADDAEKLYKVFAAITQTITDGLKEGVVTDGLPTGVTAVEGSGFATTWTLDSSSVTPTTSSGYNVYTYTKTYKVNVDPAAVSTVKVGEVNYAPLNTPTILTVQHNGSPVQIPFPIPAGKVTYSLTDFDKALVTEDNKPSFDTDGFTIPANTTDPVVVSGEGVTLLYKITVEGNPGAKFTVTDDGATLVSPKDDTITANNSPFSGTVGNTGTTVFYVSKQFTQDNIVESGDKKTVSNTATIAHGDNANGPADDKKTQTVITPAKEPDPQTYTVTYQWKEGMEVPEGASLPTGNPFTLNVGETHNVADNPTSDVTKNKAGDSGKWTCIWDKSGAVGSTATAGDNIVITGTWKFTKDQPKTGNLIVKKVVSGEGVTLNDLPNITITVAGTGTNSTYSRELTLATQDTAEPASKTVATWTISDLPAGEYIVSESSADVKDYTYTAAYNNGTANSDTVNVKKNETSAMTVTNTYTKNATVKLSDLIKKELKVKKDSTLPDNTTFTVTVTPMPTGDQGNQLAITGTTTNTWENGTTDTTTGDTIYTVPFDFKTKNTLSLSAGTYTYTVQENATSPISGMQYDSNTYTLKITVTGSSYSAEYTTTNEEKVTPVTADSPLTIKNTYQTPNLTVTKEPYKVKVNDTFFDADKTVAHVNDQIIWKVNVTNTKTTQASTQLKDTLGGVTVYSDEKLQNSVNLGTDGTWTAKVPADTTVTYYVTYTVQAKDIPNGKIVNTIVKDGNKNIPSDPVSTWDSKQLKSAKKLDTSDWTTTVTLTLPTVNGNKEGTPETEIPPDPITAISNGSYVIDQIGKDFTFVPELTLEVGEDKYTVTEGTSDASGATTYTFGSTGYKVTYTDKNTETNAPAQFKWEINQDIPAETKVTLSYKLKLTNPQTAAGTHGKDDLDGSLEIPESEALYTNKSAILYKKEGNTKLAEFPKPSVSYTVSSGSSGSHSGGSRPSLNTKDHYGYIIGYPVDYYTGQPTTDQTKKPVRPEGKITRAEVATIYFRMLTDESRTKFWSQSNAYSDVKTGDWFNNAVSTLSNAGIIAGYEDGSFRPNGYITRAEFATIAARFFDVTYNGKDLFPDISGHWAKDYINQAANKGFVNGYEDGTFKPDRNITRAEAVTLVNRTLDRHPDKNHFTKDMLVWPDNMDQTKWYYADMQEATNSHTYQMKENSDKTKYENWTKTLPIRNWEALEKAWSNANSSQGNGNVV